MREGPELAAEMLIEGWYLMSVADLEAELANLRDPSRPPGGTTLALSRSAALAFRDAGNLPDEHGRTLRLVLEVGAEPLDKRRLRYEPDFHDAPVWRRDGSKPVNVIPLRTAPQARAESEGVWWEQADVADLEREWADTGMVAGLVVPAEYRSFVLKTIASMGSAGLPIDVGSVTGSLSRWLDPDQVAEIRRALLQANANEPPG